LIMYGVVALILDDHVEHDHTCSHHLPHHLSTLSPRRVSNNGPMRLEHTKRSLHILSSCLLLLSKSSLLLISRSADGLYKYGPFRIDPISKIIPFAEIRVCLSWLVEILTF
jgi:hypothetical protein